MHVNWEELAVYWIMMGMFSVGFLNYHYARRGEGLQYWEELVIFVLGPVSFISLYCAYAGRKMRERSTRAHEQKDRRLR